MDLAFLEAPSRPSRALTGPDGLCQAFPALTASVRPSCQLLVFWFLFGFRFFLFFTFRHLFLVQALEIHFWPTHLRVASPFGHFGHPHLTLGALPGPPGIPHLILGSGRPFLALPVSDRPARLFLALPGPSRPCPALPASAGGLPRPTGICSYSFLLLFPLFQRFHAFYVFASSPRFPGSHCSQMLL